MNLFIKNNNKMALETIGTYSVNKLESIKNQLLNNGFVQEGYSFNIKNTYYYIQFTNGYIHYMDFSKRGYTETLMRSSLKNIDGISIN